MANPRSSFFFIKLTIFCSIVTFCLLNLSGRHGMSAAIPLVALLWSWWVLCMPFFGGGIIFYPFVWWTGVQADYRFELMAWTASAALNAVCIPFAPSLYHKTGLTHLLHWFLTHPWPYWLILGCAFLPILASMAHHELLWPKKIVWYYNIRLCLIVLSLVCTGIFSLHEMIILSNIHA